VPLLVSALGFPDAHRDSDVTLRPHNHGGHEHCDPCLPRQLQPWSRFPPRHRPVDWGGRRRSRGRVSRSAARDCHPMASGHSAFCPSQASYMAPEDLKARRRSLRTLSYPDSRSERAGSYRLAADGQRSAGVTSALLHSTTPAAATIAAGLLMARLGSVKGLIESRHRVRWCASCHRRTAGRRCACERER
jgi:hypothetical protein